MKTTITHATNGYILTVDYEDIDIPLETYVYNHDDRYLYYVYNHDNRYLHDDSLKSQLEAIQSLFWQLFEEIRPLGYGKHAKHRIEIAIKENTEE